MSATTTLLSAPFRPFFIAAAAHALIAAVVWVVFLMHGVVPSGFLPDPFAWHGHTMISGFAGAVIAGFLLTAAANWTGRPTTSPAVLPVVVGFWLVARIGDYTHAVPPLVALVADTGFWLLVALLVVRVVVASRNWRNLGFAFLPLAFGAVDLAWHLGHAGIVAGISRPALWVGVDLLTLILGAMGGRVIPFFTQNRLRTARVRNSMRLQVAVAALLVAAIPVNFFFPNGWLAALVMLVAGVLVLVRLAGWNSAATRGEPMLWILHAGYAWLGLGLVLRAVAAATGAFPPSTALHAVTVGALGALALGMIARVALGHTGRAIAARPALVVAFVLVILAGIARTSALFPAPTWLALGVSAFLWAIAFAIYLWQFVPILLAPRMSS